MSPFVKKVLQILIAVILQLIDLFDGDDPNKAAKEIMARIEIIKPEDGLGA
jgi:hypothetical protein